MVSIALKKQTVLVQTNNISTKGPVLNISIAKKLVCGNDFDLITSVIAKPLSNSKS